MERVKITVVAYKNVFGTTSYVAAVRGDSDFAPRGGDSRAEALGYFVEDNVGPLSERPIGAVEYLTAATRDEAMQDLGVWQ